MDEETNDEHRHSCTECNKEYICFCEDAELSLHLCFTCRAKTARKLMHVLSTITIGKSINISCDVCGRNEVKEDAYDLNYYEQDKIPERMIEELHISGWVLFGTKRTNSGILAICKECFSERQKAEILVKKLIFDRVIHVECCFCCKKQVVTVDVDEGDRDALLRAAIKLDILGWVGINRKNFSIVCPQCAKENQLT